MCWAWITRYSRKKNQYMINKKIWLSPPHIGTKEQEFVKEAFDTNWIAPLGPHIDRFESDLQSYTGAKYAAALSSGTAAIHLSLILLGVQPGDLVICQSLTFSASANPIKYLGATPVFIDSEPQTWNMCPYALEDSLKKLTANGQKPKAILPVHLYGMPARMDEIMRIASYYGIPVVEDAAEALGSEVHGRKCGTFGKFGILSFNGNKIITTSGGGALLSDDEAMIQKARFLATLARDPAPHYQHSEVGYNYRMSNVLAAIGRGQMTVLKDHITARRANYRRYKIYFESLKNKGYSIQLLPEPENYFSNRWLTTIILDPAHNNGITHETVRLALEAHNIECRPLWKPMHLQPVFADAPFYGNGTSENLFENGLCLPSGSNLTEPEWERILEALDQVFV